MLSLNRLFANIYAGGALSTLIRIDIWPRSHSLSVSLNLVAETLKNKGSLSVP